MGSITFRHQDGDMTFRVADGAFAVSPTGRLNLSLKCEPIRKYDWMAIPCFCLIGFPLESPLATGTTIRFAGIDSEVDYESEGPRAHVYTGFHDEPRDVEGRFNRVEEDECDVELSWTQADVNYYDDRARPVRVEGQCTLRRGPIESIWIPT